MLQVKCCQSRHDPIDLPDKVSITLGRSPQTKIADKACSRQQLELTADHSNGTVTLKQIGVNPSRHKGEDVAKGETRTLKVGDKFCFFSNEYPYEIIGIKSKSSQKRTIDSFFGVSSTKGESEPQSKKTKTEPENDNASDNENEVARKLNLLKGKDLVKSNSAKPVKTPANPVEKVEKSESQSTSGWSEYGDMVVYHSPLLYNSPRIAGFDMDGTLITTASGKTFAKDAGDWKILFSEIPGKLKKLSGLGYKIVLITNQLGIGKGKVKLSDFQFKVENILKKLGVPALVIAITKRGPNRKPNIGAWNWLEQHGNGSVTIDMSESYYIGDAAGRPKDWAPKKKKDFSCTDRLFALNLGIDFKTPEEFFLAQKPAKFNMPEFDPKSVSSNTEAVVGMKEFTSKKQEVVVMVGYPASGKSSFSKEYFASQGYIVVNRDIMKTWQKCVAACNQALSVGKSVVIDNTNPDPQSRKRYIDCVKARGCDIRCFVMNVTMEHARHNNRFRELSGSDHDKVPDMVFYQYRKIYQEPKMEEGFSSILQANFVPKFASEDLGKKYLMYTD